MPGESNSTSVASNLFSRRSGALKWTAAKQRHGAKGRAGDGVGLGEHAEEEAEE